MWNQLLRMIMALPLSTMVEISASMPKIQSTSRVKLGLFAIKKKKRDGHVSYLWRQILTNPNAMLFSSGDQSMHADIASPLKSNTSLALVSGTSKRRSSYLKSSVKSIQTITYKRLENQPSSITNSCLSLSPCLSL